MRDAKCIRPGFIRAEQGGSRLIKKTVISNTLISSTSYWRIWLTQSSSGFGFQLIAFKANPYTWDATSSIIRSKVIDITLRTSRGEVIEITNLTKPIGIQIPKKLKKERSTSTKQPRHLFLKPGAIQYHKLRIPSRAYLVSLKIATIDGRRLAVYFGRGFKPNTTNYTSMASLPDFSFCQFNNKSDSSYSCTVDPHTIKLTSNNSGPYYVGIRLVDTQDDPVARLRRSCTDTKKRRKRSCVEVKDPPTTPPPTATTVTSQYDVRVDVNYTFSVTMGTCLYWSEEEDKWSRRGCKVISTRI